MRVWFVFMNALKLKQTFSDRELAALAAEASTTCKKIKPKTSNLFKIVPFIEVQQQNTCLALRCLLHLTQTAAIMEKKSS